MKAPRSRKQDWPRKITVGRASVTVYKRTTPNGSPGFMVANYSGQKRRFDSYAEETEAIEAAQRLARQMSERDVLTASMTREQAVEFASGVQTLKPFNVSLVPAVTALAEAVKITGDLPTVVAACRFYIARHKRTTAKRVADVVAELLAVKESRGASVRYLKDLRLRLNKFADDFQCDACNVITAQVQAWLDRQRELSSQSYANYRRVIGTLFKFAVARGYAHDNPVDGVERVKIRNGEIQIYAPTEIAGLLAAASPEFLPCIVLGAFCGLRSAEIQRLTWEDIRLDEKFVVIGKDNAKVASRRIVPLSDNAVKWLQSYTSKSGKSGTARTTASMTHNRKLQTYLA